MRMVFPRSFLLMAGLFGATVSAAPVASNDIVRAATRWAALNPLLGAGSSVTATVPFSAPSVTVYLVTFSPKGAAVFAADTLQTPCRWFATDGRSAADLA